jgi:hypothetical protein
MPQISREEYEKLGPFDAWIHRLQHGEPGLKSPLAPVNRMGLSVNVPEFKLNAPEFETDVPAPIKKLARQMKLKAPTFELNLPGMSEPAVAAQSAGSSGPSQDVVDRIKANRTLTPSAEGPSQASDLLHRAFLSGPVPAITTPEETMIDTHMDTQRGIIAGNNAARESRRSYIPDAASEKQNTASRLRNKLTGQVDEMSNLGGGRGQMLMALADRDRVDLSSPEGRRAAFGAAPKVGNVAPYAGGTTKGIRGETVRTPQRQRMLDRKQAVNDYDAERRGAAASGIDAASEGWMLEDVLRGLPASAQRGARRAYMAEQQRQKAVEAEKALIEAGQQQGGAQTDPRIGPLLAQLENPLTSPEERERASQMLNWIIAGMGGG